MMVELAVGRRVALVFQSKEIPELQADFADHPTMSLAEKKYASMVKMLDDHVGLIVHELETSGLDENTVILFACDNGHERYYSPKPDDKNQRLPNGEKTNLTDKKLRTREGGDVFVGAKHIAKKHKKLKLAMRHV